MSKSLYKTPIKVKCLSESSGGKYIKVDRIYKCIGEYNSSNGNKLYILIDETKFENFYSKDKFAVIGNWDKVDVIVESEE